MMMMLMRGGTEGGRRGFQGAAASRSTKTDAVERRWLEQEQRGECVRVFQCVWGEQGEEEVVNPTASFLLQQPSVQ